MHQKTINTDEELVVLTLQNKDFFAYIIDRYKSKIFRYISRLTNLSDFELHDVLQDIFIKVYENLNDFDSDLKFSSWIYRVAHNQIIDVHRKNKARPQGHYIDVEDFVLQNIANDFDVVEQANLEYSKKYIGKALNSLDQKYREVLILRFFEEKDYKEISDILKKPPGTVATLLNRAKKQLKKNINKYYE